MANLFKLPDQKNKPNRNGFDLSHKTAFTAKAGELLPLWHKTVMPGDKFKISNTHTTRTMPVETAAFTRLNEYYDYYFVPYKLLYKNAPETLTEMINNSQYASSATTTNFSGTNLPQCNISDLIGSYNSVLTNMSGLNNTYIQGSTNKNFAGIERLYATAKLFNHLGYSYTSTDYINEIYSNTLNSGDLSAPYANDIPVSLFPLAAYQKIYMDHFRNDKWESNYPYCYNFDYLDSTAKYTIPSPSSYYYNNDQTLFTLRYVNQQKDLFFGMLPESQYGEVATADSTVDGNLYIPSKSIDMTTTSSGETYNTGGGFDIDSNSDLQSHLDILNLRKSTALQRYKEILNTGNQDYKSMIEKIYGVKLPQISNNTSTYLGGFQNPLNIQEVTNTNLSDDNAATLQGKGYAERDEKHTIEFEAKEHGIIMCLYHCKPMIDYSLNTYHFDVTKTSVSDYANPIFDNLGMQELPAYYLDTSLDIEKIPTIGYVSRYFDYKTSIDNIQGAFRSTLPNWLSPINKDYIYQIENLTLGSIIGITYPFFKVNPCLLDSIFYAQCDSSVDTDQLLINCEHNIKAVRNLSFDGMPNS